VRSVSILQGLAFVGLVSIPLCLGAQEPGLVVDEAWRDPRLVLARHDVVAAALRRDTAALRPLIGDRFLWSFGGGDDFMRHLAGAPDTWREMVEVLSLGGRFSAGEDGFTAPFWWGDRSCVEPARRETTTADTVEDQEGSHFTCDGFELLVVLGIDVRVRQTPGGTPIEAVSLGYVSNDRSRRETRVGGEMWTPVILPNETRGWIASRLLRSPVGWRAGFTKGADGKWKLTMFVAGD
jgi:hypothetical protein